MKTMIFILSFIFVSLTAFAGGSGVGQGSLGDGSNGGGSTKSQTSNEEYFDESGLITASSGVQAAGASDPFNSADLVTAKNGPVGDMYGGSSGNIGLPKIEVRPRIIFYQGETPKTIYFKMGEMDTNRWLIEQHKLHKGITPVDPLLFEALKQSKQTRDWSKIHAPRFSR